MIDLTGLRVYVVCAEHVDDASTVIAVCRTLEAAKAQAWGWEGSTPLEWRQLDAGHWEATGANSFTGYTIVEKDLD
jgi:hypothetical protein